MTQPHHEFASPEKLQHRSRVVPENERRRRLDVFVGKWHMEGRQHAGPIGPDTDVSAVQTFEWLDGNAFLIHRFDGRVGESDAACIEILSYDTDRAGYRAHTFYNNGLMNVWDVTERNGTWMFLGDWNMSSTTLKVRCTIEFGDHGKTMRARWEYSKDGAHWQRFWDVKARKALAS